MTEATLLHVRHLIKNLWKLVHPLTSVAASSLCREDQLAFAAKFNCSHWSLPLSCSESNRQIWSHRPSRFRTKTQGKINKSMNLMQQQQKNKPGLWALTELPLLTLWPLYRLGIRQTTTRLITLLPTESILCYKYQAEKWCIYVSRVCGSHFHSNQQK